LPYRSTLMGSLSFRDERKKGPIHVRSE
jgi:hypothetical protein